MSINKRFGFALFLTFCLALPGCVVEKQPEQFELRTIYTSFFPLYVLTQPLLDGVGDKQLRVLAQPQDGCLRHYTLSDWDAGLLTEADVLICMGRSLESFASGLTDGQTGFSVIQAGTSLTLLGQEVEIPQGDDEASHFIGENPWMWMSLQEAPAIANEISEGLSILDEENASLYHENVHTFSQQVEALYEELTALLAPHQGRKVAVLHEAMPYVARDFGLEIALTLEREPGSGIEGETLSEWIDQLQKLEINAVLLERQAPLQLRRALLESGISVAALDTLTTLTPGGEENYIGIMRKNGQTLLDALTNAANKEAMP